MSGYGGNLTYPVTKRFWNNPTFGASPGVVGDSIRLINDKKLVPASTALAPLVLFIEDGGEYIPGGSANGASYTQVDYKAAAPKMSVVKLEDRAPFDTSNHELGFTIKKIAQHPGVLNDNFYGQRRTYVHKFDYLDPVNAGKITDADLMRAYADITSQINDDTGRFTGHLQGSVEAVVTANEKLTLSAGGDGKVFVDGNEYANIAAATTAGYVASAGAVGATPVTANTAVGDQFVTVSKADADKMYVGKVITLGVADAGDRFVTGFNPTTTPAGGNVQVMISGAPLTVAGGTTTVASGAESGLAAPATDIYRNDIYGLANPGHGYYIEPAAGTTLAGHELELVTKPEYMNLSTHQVEDLSGTYTEVDGNFELLPWEEVYREFAHMEHMVPLSNFHADQKPNDLPGTGWSKFILYTNHQTGTFHGASHGGNYKESAIFYVPQVNAGTLATLLTAWIA